jgi:hypothetical protein
MAVSILIFEDEIYRINFFDKLAKLFEAEDYFITCKLELIKRKLKEKKWDVLFLDHDVDSVKYTGYDVAKFIVREGIEIPQIFIHSMNPVGAENIKNILPHATIRPFSGILALYSKEIS